MAQGQATVIDQHWYKDFRNPPWEDTEYRRSTEFWHVLAARLAFVVVFENVVVVITSLISWLIPDVPTILKEQIHREAYITNEIVLKTELKRAHGEDLSSFGGTHASDDEINYSPQHSEDVELTHRNVGLNSSGDSIITMLQPTCHSNLCCYDSHNGAIWNITIKCLYYRCIV
ncbi:Anoctamin-3 [Bulinus truncatus]|nr:Anoctamin-3 [Bulinus truncatus]